MKQGIDETKGKDNLSPLCLNQYHSHKQTYVYSFALQWKCRLFVICAAACNTAVIKQEISINYTCS